MAKAKRYSPKRLVSEPLLNRLQKQISALEKIKVTEGPEQAKLTAVIADLKQEAKTLKKFFPHLYFFVPKK